MNTTSPDFDPFDPPTISEDARKQAQMVAENAARMLEPANAREVDNALAQLEITHPKRTMSGQEQTLFWASFYEDLGTISAPLLSEACKRWRQDPNNRFFPNGAELRALVVSEIRRWQEGAEHAKAIVEYERPEPQVRVTPERMAEIREEMSGEQAS